MSNNNEVKEKKELKSGKNSRKLRISQSNKIISDDNQSRITEDKNTIRNFEKLLITEQENFNKSTKEFMGSNQIKMGNKYDYFLLFFLYSPISKFLENKQDAIEEDIKDLLPSNIASNAFTSDIAKKVHKKKEKQKDMDKNYKVFFPKYEGKIYDPTLSKTIKILEQNEEQLTKEIHKRNNNINLLKNELLDNNVNNIHDLEKERKKLEERIRAIENEKNLFTEKLEELRNRKNSMKFEYEKELGIIENNKKMKLKKFLDDFSNIHQISNIYY